MREKMSLCFEGREESGEWWDTCLIMIGCNFIYIFVFQACVYICLSFSKLKPTEILLLLLLVVLIITRLIITMIRLILQNKKERFFSPIFFSLKSIQPHLHFPEIPATQSLKLPTLSLITDSRPKRDEERNGRLSGFRLFSRKRSSFDVGFTDLVFSEENVNHYIHRVGLLCSRSGYSLQTACDSLKGFTRCHWSV